MAVYDSVAQLTGRTPLLRLTKLSALYGCRTPILAKLECFNPTGSVKDRAVFSMLLAAMDQLGADPDKTVFVGDSEVDIAPARAADLPCISVLWGFRDRDVLERAGAQQFAADIAQLQALLG